MEQQKTGREFTFRLPTLKFPKKTAIYLASGALIVTIVLFGINLFWGHANPLPASIRQQLSIAAIYPITSHKVSIDQSSYKYLSDQKNLTFNVDNDGTKIVLSEQPAPGDSRNPSLVYYQSLGLHPVAQIQTNFGLAVLVNFYSSSSYAQFGQDAIVVKNGTMLIAHPDKNMSPEAWKTFINGLDSSK